MTLFDLGPYGGDLPKRRRASDSDASASYVVEAREAGWHLVRGRAGPKPFFHLVKATNPEFGVLTVCDEWGTLVDTSGVSRMVRCPTCAEGVADDR